MARGKLALAGVVAAALLLAGAALSAGNSGAPITQELTITVSDGTQLACGLVLSGSSPPAAGWPAVILFPGLGVAGQTHAGLEKMGRTLATAGFAALTCDERGTGASGGKFDLAGPTDVQDARDLFAWLAARPDVSNTEIGAFGVSSGGAEVWNAAVAGVPFKAIVPALTWTSLGKALVIDRVAKVGEIRYFGGSVPGAWDASLSQARRDLSHGLVSSAAEQALAARSSRARLHSLRVPTLIVQGRQDFFFDLAQATTAYKLLAGPKRLYVGQPSQALSEVVAWFEEYLDGGKPVGGGVELTHAPWDGKTTIFPGLPPQRSVSVNLPGTSDLVVNGSANRSVRLPGGPLETFGGGSVVVRYSGATFWKQLVATVSVKGKALVPVTEGAAPITAAAGVVKIPLMDEMALLPRGKRLVVTIGAGSPDGIFQAPTKYRSIRIERATLDLSLLQRPVSR